MPSHTIGLKLSTPSSEHNIYGNKHAPSWDITHKFATIEQIRYICEEGSLVDFVNLYNVITYMYIILLCEYV